jgi:hypothetical protein
MIARLCFLLVLAFFAVVLLASHCNGDADFCHDDDGNIVCGGGCCGAP